MTRRCTCKLFKMLPLAELLNISNFSLKREHLLQLSLFWGFNNRGLLGTVLIAFVGLEGHLNCLNVFLVCITKEGCAAVEKEEMQ